MYQIRINVFQTFCGDLQYLRLDLRSFQAYLTRSTLPSIFCVVFYRLLAELRRIAQEAEENLLLIILDLEVHLDDDEKVQKITSTAAAEMIMQ